MKRNRIFLAMVSLIFLLSTVACSSRPDIDVNEISVKVKEQFDQTENTTTASSFDGKKDIKFRLMVVEPISEDEANDLFVLILSSYETYSGHTDFWKYYNGYFDLKSTTSGNVIYEATKIIGDDLQLVGA